MKKKSKKAFSLVEVMVVLAVLSITVLSINWLQHQNHKIAVGLGCRGEAVALARDLMDSLQATGISVVVDGRKTETRLNREFDVSWRVLPLALSDTMMYGVPYIVAKTVWVEVGWDISGSSHSIKMQTVVE